ncbi:MAG TPA: lysophospholipid acyltransferase family protein [Methylomirabilota bacterium]|nr:lysophospholipid acyltransferase family protein [Methylomirabilota bacterium]
MLYAVLKQTIAVVGRAWFRLSAIGVGRVPREGRLLVAANHLSMLDPALIGAVMPRELDYMAKTELFGIPGFGALIRRLNAHPVDRTGSDAAALRLALRLLGDGRAVLVFPEGTRGVEGQLRPARAGAGMLAALSGAPVVPAYIQGSGRALPRGAVVPRPTRVTVRFGAPIRFARGRGKTRYQDVSDEIMAAIGRLKTEAERGDPAAAEDERTDFTTPGRALAGRIH